MLLFTVFVPRLARYEDGLTVHVALQVLVGIKKMVFSAFAHQATQVACATRKRTAATPISA